MKIPLSQADQSILAFTPYAGLVEHSRLEHNILQQVASSGAHVQLLSCRGSLPTPCTTMDAILGVDNLPRKGLASAVCRFCREAGGQLSANSGLHQVFIEDLVDEQLRAECRNLAHEVTPGTWRNLVVDGIAVGRHAAYIGLIRAKATSPSDLEGVWDRYVADLEASLITLRAMQTLLSQSHFSAAVTFGGLYGPERVFHRVASAAKIPLVVLEGSILNQERHTVVHAFMSDAKYAHAVFDPEWSNHRRIPLDRSTAERVRVHQEALLDSANPLVYSSDRNKELSAAAVRERFKIPNDAHVLLVLISSPDEEVAREYTVELDPAPDRDSVTLQATMVEQVVEFAQRNPSVHVVVRLHPRLFGDHRTTTASPALLYYARLADGAPSNVHINSPDQKLSLYDLAIIADAGLVHQSTAGLELLALGLPVVASGPGFMMYPSDLIHLASEADGLDFNEVLWSALAAPPELSRTRDAYRWWGFVSNFNRMPTVGETVRSVEASTANTQLVARRSAPKRNFRLLFRRVLPTQIRQHIALRIRRRRLRGIAENLTVLRITSVGDAPNVASTFWTVASGRNDVTSNMPMTAQEEDQFLREQVCRMATLLHIDSASHGKLGRFVSRIQLENGATQ